MRRRDSDDSDSDSFLDTLFEQVSVAPPKSSRTRTRKRTRTPPPPQRQARVRSKPTLVTADTLADPGSLLEQMRLDQVRMAASASASPNKEKTKKKNDSKGSQDETANGSRKKKKKRSPSSEKEEAARRKKKKKKRTSSPSQSKHLPHMALFRLSLGGGSTESAMLWFALAALPWHTMRLSITPKISFQHADLILFKGLWGCLKALSSCQGKKRSATAFWFNVFQPFSAGTAGSSLAGNGETPTKCLVKKFFSVRKVLDQITLQE